MIKLCECGCGQPAPIAQSSNATTGRVKGRPLRYVQGHNRGPLRKGPDFVVDQNGCWIWQFTKNPCGYGMVRHDGRMTPAHRVYYERHIGAVPDGLQLDHLCRVRACVNPAHLEPVTNAENCRRGANVKLTLGSLAEIRTSDETHSALARRFGVHRSTIARVRADRSWSGVAHGEASS